MAVGSDDNVCVIAGDDFFYDVQFTQNDETIPIDLTGATAKMDLKDLATDVAVIESMSGGIVDALKGQMRFTLTDDQTNTLLSRATPNRTYVFSVKITFQDATEQTILTGSLAFTQVVTA